jgi:hypothetical protein
MVVVAFVLVERLMGSAFRKKIKKTSKALRFRACAV